MAEEEEEVTQKATTTSSSNSAEDGLVLSKKDRKKMAKKQQQQQKPAVEVEKTTATTTSTPESTVQLILSIPTSCEESEAWKLFLARATFSSLFPTELEIQTATPTLGNVPALYIINDEQQQQQFVIYGSNAILTYFVPSWDDIKVDHWLEWENQVLRKSSKSSSSSLMNVWQPLEQALSHSNGTTVVQPTTTNHTLQTNTSTNHHSMSIADVVIVSTLVSKKKEDTIEDFPPFIQHYMEYHSSAIASAQLQWAKLSSSSKIQHFNPMEDASLDRAVESVFATAIQTAFPSIPQEILMSTILKVQKCTSIKHGHYQCNSAMPLFAHLKKTSSSSSSYKSPPEVAKAIVAALQQQSTSQQQRIVDPSTLTITGPGFIMCHLTCPFLQAGVNRIIVDGQPIPPSSIATETIVVDFSSPNIAKEMHVGHLRSTIIGESVCRILEYCGNHVLRMNHVGDWGTQFGMLIQYLREEYPTIIIISGVDSSSSPNITDLTQFYKNAKARFDEDPVFKKQSQLNVVALQSGDEECIQMWKLLCDISRGEFQKVYDRLSVHLEEYGESFYNSRIPNVIEEFTNKGLVKVEEGGAKCVFVEEEGGVNINNDNNVPLMLQKSDGGFGYDSTDMAALKYRIQELGATRIIVITDFTQAGHFKLCFKAAEMIGWIPTKGGEDKVRLQHIGFGTVQGEDGKRFKTRSGDTVRLVDLLDEAVLRMESQLRERISSGSANIAEDELHKTACILGYGAVKYFDLRRNPTSNYIFSYDRMLDTKGNTAIYLLYAHARLESIISKAKADYEVDVDDLIASKAEIISIHHPSEINLAFHLLQFADCIEVTLEDMLPYHICDFLYNASIAVSEFVTQCKVLGSPEMKSRLLLCRATALVMRQCFELLGIGYVTRI